jgi:hypothetical protein
VTVGQPGPEHGFILRDEEYGDPEDDEDSDARLTLEQGRVDNPGFFLTATLYGWMFHTHRADDETDAEAKYAAMRSELEILSERIPHEENRDVAGKARVLVAAIADFEGKYPAR